jgi:probable addiction module antidote protein
MMPKSNKPKSIADRMSEALAQGDTAAFTAALMEDVRERGLARVAKQVGMSRHSLYRYEWGERPPSFETTLKILSACGYKVVAVFDDEALPEA